MPVCVDRDGFTESGCRQLLAMHDLRRDLERIPPADDLVRGAAMAVTRSQAVRELLELIAALDRRVPQVERAGESAIARDAAALKARAMKRIEALERSTTSV